MRFLSTICISFKEKYTSQNTKQSAIPHYAVGIKHFISLFTNQAVRISNGRVQMKL